MSPNLANTLNKIIENNGKFFSDQQHRFIISNVTTPVPRELTQLCKHCSWVYEQEFKKQFGHKLISKYVSINYVYLGNEHGINYKLKSANQKELEGDKLILYRNEYYVIVWKQKSSDEFNSNVGKANAELTKILNYLQSLHKTIHELDTELQTDILKHVTNDIDDEIKSIIKDNNVSLHQIDANIIKDIKLLY